MAGRGDHRGGDGGGDDDSDFDWIYGQPGGGRAGSTDPEPTRRIPVQRRDAGARSGPPPPPASMQPPGRPPLQHRPRRWSRPRFWVRLVIVVLALWLAFTVAVPFLTWSKVGKVDYEPEGDRPAEQPGTTWLLVGSDSRAGLTPKERRKLHTGDAASELTDTILLLHTGSGPTTLISIPRDSPLDIPGFGVGKVNSAYAKGGTAKLVQTLEKATGVRIDGYVEIGFGGLVGVVDAIGGIEVCPQQRIKDRDSGLNIKKGCQNVDGATALAYSRARKHSPISDLARVQQQREVIAAVGDKVLSVWSVANPLRWWRLNSAVPDFFRFGDGVSAVAAGKWALAMTSTGRSCTVPVARADTTWDTERAQRLFAAVIADRTQNITDDICTASGLAD